MRQIRRIEKRKRREERRRLEEELGPDAPPKGVPRTLENMRAFDETYVMGADKEVEDEEMMDEFSDHYLGRTSPKIFITTSLKYTKLCREFVRHLALLFPNAQVYPRKKYSVGVLIDYAIRNGFTDLLVVNEDHKQLNGMIHCHLPGGPTAIFRLSSVKMLKEIGKVKLHSPELILNNFTTRLGRTIGRMLGALVPLTPEFEGRRVITIHNQRDYIFFRHHIYEFEGPAAANLRELGPSFTLKLKSLQSGLFDKKHGEYLFQHKRENQPYSRKKFVL
ncbi:ribosome production factor 1-like [Schistocerca gregaria]|uniref:ribosome production factor 1-like n=1 Tax=Schistocerca gregaria TaxID=7010 RepID=UPI00211EB0DA|nr:ribosome production factor 1-like [Schistocerca gregaria]